MFYFLFFNITWSSTLFNRTTAIKNIKRQFIPRNKFILFCSKFLPVHMMPPMLGTAHVKRPLSSRGRERRRKNINESFFCRLFNKTIFFYPAVMSFTLLVNNDARPPDGEVRNNLFKVSLVPSYERTNVFNMSITQRQSNYFSFTWLKWQILQKNL